MKNTMFLLSLCSLFSLVCMEEPEKEEEIVVHEDLRELEGNFVIFTSSLCELTTPMYVGTITTEHFLNTTHSKIWHDLNRLKELVIKRLAVNKFVKYLERYTDATQDQLSFFYQGITLLSKNDELSEQFKQNIKKQLNDKKHKEYFKDNFCKRNIQATPNDWLQLRIAGLETLHKKLEEKTLQERALNTCEQTPYCVIGMAVGGLASTLYTPYWFFGAAGCLVGTCLFAGCPSEVCEDFRPSILCSNKHDIDHSLANTIRLLHLSESKILKKAQKQKKSKAEAHERDALLPKDQIPKKPVKGKGSLNSISASVNG